MKKIFIGASLLLFTLATSAQNTMQEVLRMIETNNTTLKAYREKADAEKIGNRTANNLENPEVGFGYAWNKPSSEGQEVSLDITQSFDFPTAYRNRSKLIDEQNKQSDFGYLLQRSDIIHEARLLLMELIFELKMNKELVARHQSAKELSDSYQRLFDEGSINILEKNKTRLNLLKVEKALDMSNVNIEALKSDLKRLNGGESVPTITHQYSNYTLPINFAEWMIKANENNPNLKLAEQEVAIGKRDIQLTKSLNLPKLSAGYTSEYDKGNTGKQGFTIGVSLPLWGGRNTVKHKKAQVVALDMELVDKKLQFQNSLRLQYDKACKLSSLLKDYNDVLTETNSDALLKKAFDQGQLSLINYLLELEIYYDVIDEYLSTEKDYQLALAELMKWEN